MRALYYVLVGAIGLIHLGFWYLKGPLWTQPLGRKIFGTTKEFAEASRTLAANQGLYNGLVGLGLLQSLVMHFVWGWTVDAYALQTYLLWFVFIAGLFGGASVSKRILWIQALPALAAIVLDQTNQFQ